MELPDNLKADAVRMHQYYPYRKIWLVHDNNGYYLICKATAHKVNSEVRKGAEAAQLHF